MKLSLYAEAKSFSNLYVFSTKVKLTVVDGVIRPFYIILKIYVKIIKIILENNNKYAYFYYINHINIIFFIIFN